jgi:hypothetical protein
MHGVSACWYIWISVTLVSSILVAKVELGDEASTPFHIYITSGNTSITAKLGSLAIPGLVIFHNSCDM